MPTRRGYRGRGRKRSGGGAQVSSKVANMTGAALKKYYQATQKLADKLKPLVDQLPDAPQKRRRRRSR